jgi:competence protein ComEC
MFLSRELIFVRLLIPFLAGIFTAIFIPAGVASFIIAAFILLFSFGILHYITKPEQEYKRAWIHGLLISVLFFALGGVLVHLNKEIDRPEHFSRIYLEGSEVQVKVKEPPTVKPDYYKLSAEVLKVKEGDIIYTTSGQLFIYLPADTASAKISYGDIISFHSAITEVKPPANPHEFNYRRYSGFKQVYHQSYCYAGQWQRTGENIPGLLSPFYTLRDWCMSVFRNYLNAETLAMTSSLVLGYRDLLEPELVQAYSTTGTVHILSVSGLHVGIFVLLINFVFRLFKTSSRVEITRLVLSLLLIWLYACLSGLSPSVLRAAVMFSFLIIGKSLTRPANNYNALAASALLLLVIDPYLATDIGFQLSYMAVAGIMLLYPKMYALINFKYKVPDYIWQAVVLSITATLSTLPLTIYYFYQVPLLSLFANLIAVPASSIILVGGLVLLCFSWIPSLAPLIGFGLQWVVTFMNWSIEYIALIPGAAYKGLSITLAEMLLILGAIGLAIAYIHTNRPIIAIASLALFATFLTLDLIKEAEQLQQHKLVVYSVNKHSLIELVSTKSSLMVMDTPVDINSSSYNFHIAPNQYEMDVKPLAQECLAEPDEAFHYVAFHRQGDYMQLLDKRIVVLPDYRRAIKPAHPLKVNYLILTNNLKLSITDLNKLYKFDMVIFDASNSKAHAAKWEEECRDFGIACYNVQKLGAYVTELPVFASASSR